MKKHGFKSSPNVQLMLSTLIGCMLKVEIDKLLGFDGVERKLGLKKMEVRNGIEKRF